MSGTTTPEDQRQARPGGFAHLTFELLTIWPYLPEHHMRLLPLVLSFMPNAFPSQGTLAELAGVGRQQVNETVKQIAQSGLIRAEQRTRENSRAKTSSQYHVANLLDEGVRDQVVAWYAEHYPDTPIARTRRRTMSPPRGDNPAAVPMSPPEGDNPCRLLEATSHVASKTRQPMSPHGGDSVNGQGNTPLNGQGLSADYGGASPPHHGGPTLGSTPGEAVGNNGHDDHGNTAGTPPARRKANTGPSTASKGATQQRSAPQAAKGPKGLTDEQKRLACSSLAMMTRYLLHGQEGLDPTADVATLKPANSNFYRYQRSAEDLGIDQWTVHEFAGYFWFKVCEYRSKHGQPLELPNWGRLFGHLKPLVETKTRDDLLRYLRIVAEWFTVIRYMNGGAGMSMSLNEAALCHKLVDMSVGQLGLMDADGRAELWSKAQNASGNRMRENVADAA